jgi:chemotaxis response regulator CheB
MIRVLIAEDMHLIRGALVALLSLEEDMEVVAELERGDLILETALRTRPDVAVVDIDLPGMDGLTAADQLYRHLPECKTLVLTGLSQPGNVLRALKAHRAGRRRPGIRYQPAHRSRGRRAAGGGERHAHRPDRRPAVTLPRDRAQLPVQRDQQGARQQPHRRDPHRPQRRLALSSAALVSGASRMNGTFMRSRTLDTPDGCHSIRACRSWTPQAGPIRG